MRGHRARRQLLKQKISDVQQKLKLSLEENISPKTVKKLETVWNATVEVHQDDAKNFKGLYLQQWQMKQMFDAYPEYFLCEASYELKGSDFSCCCLLVQNSNGNHEVVAVGLLNTKDIATFSWFLDKLKYKIKNTKLFDRLFPETCIFISLYQVHSALKKEEKNGYLKFFKTLTTALTEKSYMVEYESFVKTAQKSVVDYYSKRWHESRHEWLPCLTFFTKSLFRTSYNPLEYVYSRLKSSIDHHSSLELFLPKFLEEVHSVREDREERIAYMIQKQSSIFNLANTPESLYKTHLTYYAFNLMRHELYSVEGVEGMPKKQIENHAYIVSDEKCSCPFNDFLKLPCKHVLAFRKKQRKPLFAESLCDIKWTDKLYQDKQKVINGNAPDESVCISAEKPKVISTLQLHKVSQLAKDLTDLIVNSTKSDFDAKINVLDSIVKSWTEEKGANIVKSSDISVGEASLPDVQITTAFRMPPEDCDEMDASDVSSRASVSSNEEYIPPLKRRKR